VDLEPLRDATIVKQVFAGQLFGRFAQHKVFHADGAL
jgi:hypothetical protein